MRFGAVGLSLCSLVYLTVADIAIRDTLSYTPIRVPCPPGIAVRFRSVIAPVLGAAEANYVLTKSKTGGSVWAEYLDNVNIAGFDVVAFLNKGMEAGSKPGFDLPNVAITVSGGGERAVMVGGGILSAFDNRNTSAVQAKTGGVLQVTNYIVGLSGGGWLVGSFALAGFPTFDALRRTVWNLKQSLFNGNDGQGGFFGTVSAVLKIGFAKLAAGYPVSLVDGFGVLIGGHFVNDSTPFNMTLNNTKPEYGFLTLWHSIRDTPAFKSFTAPYPIIISLGRVPPSIYVDATSPIYEMSPYDFGSFDPSLDGGAFIPIDYLGTNFVNGTVALGPIDYLHGKTVAPPGLCTTGFDNAGFLLAATGTAFGDPAATFFDIAPFFTGLAGLASLIPDYIAVTGRVPAPFQGLSPKTYDGTHSSELDLVDGGIGGENIPILPLLVPERHVDALIIIDASADTGTFFDGYPDGASVYATYTKTLTKAYSRFRCPAIPPPAVFRQRGYNLRPTFFGGTVCNATSAYTPTFVYIPNTNTSKLFGTDEGNFVFYQDEMVQQNYFNNGWNIATQSTSPNQTIPWSTCLACALIDGQISRNGDARPAECVTCFKEYCWDGTFGNVTAEDRGLLGLGIGINGLGTLL